MVQKNRANQLKRRERPSGRDPRSGARSGRNKSRNVEFVEVTPKGDDLEFDKSAYHVHNRLETGFPCLTFDTIPDQLGHGKQRSETYPLSFTMVAGNQVPSTIKNNTLYVMKVEDIRKLSQEDSDDDDELGDDEDEKTTEERLPKLNLAKVSHNGNVNRIRAMALGERSFAATWSDKSIVYIYDLTLPLQAVNNYHLKKTYMAEKTDPKPVFAFKGHRAEGFALDWSRKEQGTLATGDCNKDIYIWKMQSGITWNVSSQPLVGHNKSVEDIKWSPEQKDELASCSVDKSIRLWDLRQNYSSCCTTTIERGHDSDINVIDWNKLNTNLIISGGDDGIVRTWDRRYLSTSSSSSSPVASFQFHKKAITSIEWHPDDDTVFAVSSEDDRLTIWDLAVEPDDERMEDSKTISELINTNDLDMDSKDDVKMEQDDSDESSSDDDSSEDEYEDDEDEEEEKAEKEDEQEGIEYNALALSQMPPQILFVHEGQKEIKEIHWHPQIPGIVISTASDGFNIFRTISA